MVERCPGQLERNALRVYKEKPVGDHLINGEFQSDKYPWCHRGFVPLKLTDPDARVVLRIYVELRRRGGHPDTEFADDLEAAIKTEEAKTPKV